MNHALCQTSKTRKNRLVEPLAAASNIAARSSAKLDYNSLPDSPEED
jgi:hypothetical protein